MKSMRIKGEKLHTTEIQIPFFVVNSIENLLKGAPENPLPRAFTYASYKIKTSMIDNPCKQHLIFLASYQ